jgi:hypothetical protein
MCLGDEKYLKRNGNNCQMIMTEKHHVIANTVIIDHHTIFVILFNKFPVQFYFHIIMNCDIIYAKLFTSGMG